MRNRFWIENVLSMLSVDILPMKNMTLESQLNAMTRLIVIIFVMMYILNFNLAVHFLVISLIFIFIIYIIQKSKMNCIENYNGQTTTALTKGINGTNMATFVPKVRLPFCNDTVTGEVNSQGTSGYATSVNQRLVIGQNPSLQQTRNQAPPPTADPRTLLTPYTPYPSHDLTHWRFDNTINHSAVNKNTQQDMYLSGYGVSSCCASPCTKVNVERPNDQYRPDMTEAFTSQDGRQVYTGNGGIIAPRLVESNPGIPTVSFNQGNVRVQDVRLPKMVEGYDGRQVYAGNGGLQAPRLVESNPGIPVVSFNQGNVRVQDVRLPRLVEGFNPAQVKPNEPGWMNINCGYNPDQLDYNIPSNYPTGQCQQTDVMKEYNRNIYTQNAGEGVYFMNQIAEPLNSNIGISYTQTLNPITRSYDRNGQVHFVEHDPRIYNAPQRMPEPQQPNPENVYDPRLTGYGTSYRGYTDPLLGQPRFMYDDIDAIRAPPYICRSNIDTQRFSDGIGIKEGYEAGNPNTNDIRALADRAWLEDTGSFREELQTSYMRKYNSEVAPQRRLAPLQYNP